MMVQRFHDRGQLVVTDHHIPEGQRLPVQVECAGIVAGGNGIVPDNRGLARRRRDGHDCIVYAQRGQGVHGSGSSIVKASDRRLLEWVGAGA